MKGLLLSPIKQNFLFSPSSKQAKSKEIICALSKLCQAKEMAIVDHIKLKVSVAKNCVKQFELLPPIIRIRSLSRN